MPTTQVTKNRIVIIFLNFCALWSLANLKPIPDLEFYPEGCVHSGQKSDMIRVRRSIPDIDAVNPAYLETEPESEPIQELSGPSENNGISHFAISNPVNSFFRNHKSQVQEKLPTNQGPSNMAEDWSKDEELVGREIMSVDEQEECYKQQNIDPPGNYEDGLRAPLKLKDYRPFAEVNMPQQKVSFRSMGYKDKGGSKRFKDKEDEINEITSLYSDPERRPKFRKGKTQSNRNNALEQISDRSVFKPIGVRAEFPVYDEDIDFHPDPLQGILEDKYWLDPQEQEAVVRKYIDLASNIQPSGVDYKKRDLPKEEHVPKSVDSKEAFREVGSVDRECPCREVASCEDCSKGKWKKKTNYSERELLYGNVGSRRLLSINYDDIQKEEFDDESALNNNLQFESDIKPSEEYSSEDYGYFWESDRKKEETRDEEDVPSFTSKYFGRKLLSFKEDDKIKDDYGVDEDTTDYYTADYEAPEYIKVQREPLHFKSESSQEYENRIKKTNNRRSIIFDGNADVKDKTANESNRSNTDIIKPSTSVKYEYKLDTEKIEDSNEHLIPNTAEDFIKFQKPFLNNPPNIARYYVPNRLGNLLQKTIIKQQKPKEASSTVDPNLEFAIERNQTYLNVSIEMNDLNVSVTTEMAGLVKYHQKRGDHSVPLLRSKGRRSYNLPLIKHPHVKTVEEDTINANAQDSNKTGNSISSMNGTLSTSISLNATGNITANTTDSGNNITDTINSTTDATTNNTTTDNVATISTTESSTTKNSKKKMEDYDEDTFDAEIANDIVETVIAESQSGSVVGHNLGLCRRNSTVSKYAKVAPESEKLLKKVTECILEHIRDRLEGQSCTLLDNELLQFLKWMVLSGESYKDYLARIEPQLKKSKPEVSVETQAQSADVSEHVSSISPK